MAVTAGASAPEILVEDVVNYLRQNGFSSVEEIEVMPENVRFGLPPEIIQAIGNTAAGSQFPFDSFQFRCSHIPVSHCFSPEFWLPLDLKVQRAVQVNQARRPSSYDWAFGENK